MSDREELAVGYLRRHLWDFVLTSLSNLEVSPIFTGVFCERVVINEVDLFFFPFVLRLSDYMIIYTDLQTD